MFVNGIILFCDVSQLGDEDCILPSKLQAALQQILEERDDILREKDGDSCGGLYNYMFHTAKMLHVCRVFHCALSRALTVAISSPDEGPISS